MPQELSILRRRLLLCASNFTFVEVAIERFNYVFRCFFFPQVSYSKKNYHGAEIACMSPKNSDYVTKLFLPRAEQELHSDFVARKVMARHGATRAWVGLDDGGENGTLWINRFVQKSLSMKLSSQKQNGFFLFAKFSNGEQTFPTIHSMWLGGAAVPGMGQCAVLATLDRG